MDTREGLSAVKERLEKYIHDLKNEITVIQNCILALKKEIANGDKKARTPHGQLAERLMKLIENSSNRQMEYIERMSDLKDADPVTGAKTVDLEYLINKVVETYSYILKEKEINLRVEKNLDYIAPHIQCFRFDLESALLNVLKNAVESIEERIRKKPFTSKGEIVVEIQYVKDSSFVRIVFVDNGVGFESESLAFELFSKNTIEPKNYSTKGEGRGIGTRSIRDCMDIHKGTVRARNRTDGSSGAVVILTIPTKILY